MRLVRHFLSLWGTLILLFSLSPTYAHSPEDAHAVTHAPVTVGSPLLNSQGAGEDHFNAALANTAVTLIFFVAVLTAFSWVLKRMLKARQGQVNTQNIIKIVEQRSLSSKGYVYVLSILGKTLIVGESPSGLSLLATWDGDLTPPSQPARPIE